MKAFTATIVTTVVISLLCVIAACPAPAHGEDVIDVVDDVVDEVWRRITSPSRRHKQARKTSQQKTYEQEYRRNQDEIDFLKAEKRKHEEQRMREKEREIRIKEEELARKEHQLREMQQRVRRDERLVASRSDDGDQKRETHSPAQPQATSKPQDTVAINTPTTGPVDVKDRRQVFNEWLRNPDIQAALTGDKSDLVFIIRKEHPQMSVGSSDKLTGCILTVDEPSPNREFLASAKSSASKALNRDIAIEACTNEVGKYPLVVVSAATVREENFDNLKPILSDVVSSKAAIMFVADYRKYISDIEAQRKNDSARCLTVEVAGPYFANKCASSVAGELGKTDDALNFETHSEEEKKKYGCAPLYLSTIESGAEKAARDIISNETFSKLAIFSSTAERYCKSRLQHYLHSDKD